MSDFRRHGDGCASADLKPDLGDRDRSHNDCTLRGAPEPATGVRAGQLDPDTRPLVHKFSTQRLVESMTVVFQSSNGPLGKGTSHSPRIPWRDDTPTEPCRCPLTVCAGRTTKRSPARCRNGPMKVKKNDETRPQSDRLAVQQAISQNSRGGCRTAPRHVGNGSRLHSWRAFVRGEVREQRRDSQASRNAGPRIRAGYIPKTRALIAHLRALM